MFSANYRNRKLIFQPQPVSAGFCNYQLVPPGLQDHYTALLIGRQTAERLWRFVDSCIASPFPRHSGVERSKPICGRNGHLTSATAQFGAEASAAGVRFGEPRLGPAGASSCVNFVKVVHHRDSKAQML